MDSYNEKQQFTDYTVVGSKTGSEAGTVTKEFFAKVFAFMFVALAVSTIFAFLFSQSPELLRYLIDPQSARGLSTFGWIVIFAPIGFVLIMSAGYSRLSVPVLVILFLLYSALIGISFSFLILAFTTSSLIGCFAGAAAMFAVMAIMGYTTDKDLTSMGRLLMMAFVGIFVASLVNIFIGSDQLGYIIGVIGVIVFTGLVAYKVQNLKNIAMGLEFEDVSKDDTNKLAILGALGLYITFVNLFLSLLRLFGRRR